MDLFGLLVTLFFFWLIYKLIKTVVKFINRLPDIYLFDKKNNNCADNNDAKYESYKKEMLSNVKTKPSTIYYGNYLSFNKSYNSYKEDKNIIDLSIFRKKSLLTFYEKRFFEELRGAWFDKYDIYPQTQLGAIFEPKSRRGSWGPLSRLNKRIDFLIVERESQVPLLGIELDDTTHEKESRRSRDRFVEDLFRYNNIPFVRYNHGYYSAQELKEKLSNVLDNN
jgi:hypothetical protein